MRSRVVGAAVLLVAAWLLAWVIQRLMYWPVEPMPATTWRATTHGDGVVTLDRERKLLRIDVDALPQDFLICIGAVCKLPAEWRGVK